MASVVNVVVSDETTAITQEGFNSILIVDFTTDVPIAKVTDSSGFTGELKSEVDSTLSQRASEVWVYGTDLTSSGSDIGTILDGIATVDFYVLLSTSRTEDEITEIATWAASNDKLYLGQVAETTIVTDAVALAELISSENTALYAHDATDSNKLASAVAGKCAPNDVGSLTWAMQTLDSVTSVGYSGSDVSTLTEGNVNTYADVLGTNVTFKGFTTNGSYIDVTRSKAWLKARIQENVTRLLIASDKIPYNDSGISQITSAVAEVLEQANSMTIIEDGYEISAPLRSEIPTNDIANRVLNGIKATVVLTGAIESVTINVAITL